MKSVRRREFPIHFAEGKKLFHVVVHMSDSPGSLGAILDAAGEKVNLIGLTSYTLDDGTAMVSAFAEGLSQEETAAGVARPLKELPLVLEVQVTEGRDGILVDEFHTGIQVGDEDYVLLRRAGLSGVFDHIVRIFGTGGDVLLYEEGKALGERNAQRTVRSLGREKLSAASIYLARSLTAEGWGMMKASQATGSRTFTVTVTDCFECKGGSEVRHGCAFLRGYYEGSAQSASGDAKVEEIECTLRGAKACVFRVSLK